MAGVKRAPSSLVHETISIGFSVACPASFNARTSSSPASTP